MLEARSVLNRRVSRRQLSLAYFINPYRSREFTCRYHYARHTHEFLAARVPVADAPDFHDPNQFKRSIFLQKNAGPTTGATRATARSSFPSCTEIARSRPDGGGSCARRCCQALPIRQRRSTALRRAPPEARATFFAAYPLFLKSCSRPAFLSFVREHFPHLMDEYATRTTQGLSHTYIPMDMLGILQARRLAAAATVAETVPW